jgi:hypothetical protein
MIWELSHGYFSKNEQPLLETVLREMKKSTDIEDDFFTNIPENFELSQNYPNPFNATTNFKISLPKDTHLKIVIYNLQGELVEKIYDKKITAGRHHFQWDVTGKNLGTGVYILQARASEFRQTIKMVYMK